jgi:glycosyltransferase involved in cell wall biosynthesis
LTQGKYDRLKVVVVDQTLAPDEMRPERWGATDALIVSRVEQEHVGWLYGRFDVLVALSLWPESFGLVVREALAYGRWVITSNLGALAEAIVPGCNGWVVDVADPSALQRVLDELQANPERYSRPPNAVRTVRSQSDMVSDYAAAWKTELQSRRKQQAGRQ